MLQMVAVVVVLMAKSLRVDFLRRLLNSLVLRGVEIDLLVGLLLLLGMSVRKLLVRLVLQLLLMTLMVTCGVGLVDQRLHRGGLC